MNQNILYVNFSGCFFSFVLPTENNRTHEIDLSKHIKHKECIITLEYFDGIWKVISNAHVAVLNNNILIQSQPLSLGKPTYCRIDEHLNFSLLLDTLSEGHLHYEKYDITGCSEIVLGKDHTADIVIDNEYISSRHAVFVRRNNDWFIEDHSRNGLYLNNQRLPADSRVKLRIMKYAFHSFSQLAINLDFMRFCGFLPFFKINSFLCLAATLRHKQDTKNKAILSANRGNIA